MAEPRRRGTWSEVKARLQTFDREGLVSLVADLYDARAANRRFLHSRLSPGSGTVEEYRRLVADAIYPDPFSTRRVSIRDAAAAITDYQRATGDPSGTVDLMLTFVEAGTEQAVDLGYGDDDATAAVAALAGRIRSASARRPSTSIDPAALGAGVERLHHFIDRVAEAPADVLRAGLDALETGSRARALGRGQRLGGLHYCIQTLLQRVEGPTSSSRAGHAASGRCAGSGTRDDAVSTMSPRRRLIREDCVDGSERIGDSQPTVDEALIARSDAPSTVTGTACLRIRIPASQPV